MAPTVIVPFDGSATGEMAIPVAERLSAEFGARVVLVHAGVESIGTDQPAGVAELADLVARHPDLADAQVVESELAPVDAIVAVVEATDDPIVCMTSHGRGGVGRAVLGSVAEEVLGAVGVPVLVLGPHANASTGDGGLLVCLDDSVESEGALPVAVVWATALGVPTTVVTVVPRGDPAFSPVHPADPDRLLAALDGFRAAGLGAVPLTVRGVDPARAIDRLAREHQIRVIVAAPGRNDGAPGGLGSTTMALIHLAPCPVLVVAR